MSELSSFDDLEDEEMSFPTSIASASPEMEGSMAGGNISCSNENISYINITTEIPIEYALPLYGYCVPILFVITIIANTLVMSW
jgi:hypothetical protein